jgi:hypothetical protein
MNNKHNFSDPEIVDAMLGDALRMVEIHKMVFRAAAGISEPFNPPNPPHLPDVEDEEIQSPEETKGYPFKGDEALNCEYAKNGFISYDELNDLTGRLDNKLKKYEED